MRDETMPLKLAMQTRLLTKIRQLLAEASNGNATISISQAEGTIWEGGPNELEGLLAAPWHRQNTYVETSLAAGAAANTIACLLAVYLASASRWWQQIEKEDYLEVAHYSAKDEACAWDVWHAPGTRAAELLQEVRQLCHNDDMQPAGGR